MSPNIPQYLRLKDNHPTMVKFNKLCELAEELGISIEWHGQDVIIEDAERDKDLPPIFLKDIEQDHWFDSFPPNTEFKMIYNNPEFLKRQELEHQKYLSEKAERERAALEQKRIAEEQARLRRQRELEDSERAMLEALKAKYESNS